jgi:hypothetical protein
LRVSAKKKNMIRLAGVITGFWVLSVPAAESIYKWVDDDGSVHYADHPPPQVKISEQVGIESAPSDDVVRVAQERRHRLRTKQQSSQDQRSVEREQERVQTELEQAQQDDRQQRCTKANEQIQSLDHHMPIYYIDETGNRIFLDDEKRADLIAFYHREEKMFCD